jgi:hypothetical protein
MPQGVPHECSVLFHAPHFQKQDSFGLLQPKALPQKFKQQSPMDSENLAAPRFFESLFDELEALGVLARLYPSTERWKQPDPSSQFFRLGRNRQSPLDLLFSVLKAMLGKLSN